MPHFVAGEVHGYFWQEETAMMDRAIGLGYHAPNKL